MPKKKQPTLTSQIAKLTERKRAINSNKSRSKQLMTDYQAKLDEAEQLVVESVTDCMANDTAANQERASEARIARNLVMQGYEQAKHDLSIIPKALKKLDVQIAELTVQKKALERGVIENTLTDLDDLKEAAREALAELSAAMCMTTTRNPNFTNPREVSKQLDKDNSVSVLFIDKFKALESNMGFDQL